MKNKINQLVLFLKSVETLKKEINNSEYWINLAKEEAGWEPQEGDWVSVDIKTYKIMVNVYHKKVGKGIYWINGQWFNTPFPGDYPNL